VSDTQAGSHSNKGWETFTAAVLRVVTERLSPSESADHVPGAKGVVFMAWGAHAQKMCAGVDKVSVTINPTSEAPRAQATTSSFQAFLCERISCSGAGAHVQKKHLVLTSAHPSPLAASRGFFGNGHFKKANVWLEERYGPGGGIDWAALGDQ